MSNAATRFPRAGALRLALGALIALAAFAPVKAAADVLRSAPMFFSIAAVLAPGQATRASEPAAITPFSSLGYRLFRASEAANDTDWQTVRAEMTRDLALIADCAVTPRECTSEARKLHALIATARTRDGAERVSYINSSVNALVAYQSDLAHYGKADVWASPLATLFGRGDCEDYAIAKYALLLAAGTDEADLSLVLLRDARVGEDHAVLAVRADRGWTLLDNRFDRIAADSAYRHYEPIRAYSGDNASLFALPFIAGGQASLESDAAQPVKLAADISRRDDLDVGRRD